MLISHTMQEPLFCNCSQQLGLSFSVNISILTFIARKSLLSDLGSIIFMCKGVISLILDYESQQKYYKVQNHKGYSRKKYLGGEDGRRYIFLWVVGAESFQVMGRWCGKFSNYMGRWCSTESNYMGGWLAKKRQINVFDVPTCPTISPVVGHSNIVGPFCGFPWVETSTAGRVYDLCVYYMTGAPEGSPKVVLWRSRESNLRPLVYKA